MALSSDFFLERMTCPVCSGTDVQTMYECDFVADPIRQYLLDFYAPQGGVEFTCLEGARYVVRRCNQCTVMYQAQVGNDRLLGKLYGEWIHPDLARHRDADRRDLHYYVGYASEVISILSHLRKLPEEARFLDFGMGWGRWCQMVRGFGAQAYGSELSQERIDYARAAGIRVIDWEHIPGSEFDCINTEQVIEHLTMPLATLEHLAKGLAPHGILKISVPNGAAIPRLLENPDWTAPKGSRRSLNAIAPLEHVNCFNHRSLKELGRQAGLVPLALDRVRVTSLQSKRLSLAEHLGLMKRFLWHTLESARLVRSKSTYMFFQHEGRRRQERKRRTASG